MNRPRGRGANNINAPQITLNEARTAARDDPDGIVVGGCYHGWSHVQRMRHFEEGMNVMWDENGEIIPPGRSLGERSRSDRGKGERGSKGSGRGSGSRDRRLEPTH